LVPTARSPPPGFASLRVDPGGRECPHATPKPLENPNYAEPPRFSGERSEPPLEPPAPRVCELASEPGGRGATTRGTPSFSSLRARMASSTPSPSNSRTLNTCPPGKQASGASTPIPEPLAPRVCELACEPGGREATTRGTPSFSRLHVQGGGVLLRGRVGAGVIAGARLGAWGGMRGRVGAGGVVGGAEVLG